MILFLITLMMSLWRFHISGLIPAIKVPLHDNNLHETLIWQIGAFLVPIDSTSSCSGRFIIGSYGKSHRKASILSALVAAVAWELLNNAFTGSEQWIFPIRLVYGSGE